MILTMAMVILWKLLQAEITLEIETIDIIRFEDRMMVEYWSKSDTLAMIQQPEEPITNDTINNIRSVP